MRLPRMTTRRWMITILVVTFYSLAIRSAVCLGLVAYDESEPAPQAECTMRGMVYYDSASKLMTPAQVAAFRKRRNTARMCRMAAWWPWAASEPDVREPE